LGSRGFPLATTVYRGSPAISTAWPPNSPFAGRARNRLRNRPFPDPQPPRSGVKRSGLPPSPA
jgi:hypothetical protein